MVKIFPSNFGLFEKQNILTPEYGEPLAITCSNECLFVAQEGCILEVYNLSDCKPIARFRTVSPVIDFVYNARGDCIVTLERKNPTSHGFARVYFKWRGSSIDKPMRVSLLDSLTKGVLPSQDRIAAEIIELPAEANSSVTCLACCEESGRIAVGMGTTIRVFALKPEDLEVTDGLDGKGVESVSDSGDVLSSDSTSVSSQHRHLPQKIEILLDIRTNIHLRKVSIYNDYVAYISSHEARVLKLSLLCGEVGGEYLLRNNDSLENSCNEESLERSKVKMEAVKHDKDFVSWSPSRVWEAEKMSVGVESITSSMESGSSFALIPNSPHSYVGEIASHDCRAPSPLVGILSLPSVSASTSQKVTDRHPMEALGPLEYVWGQPIEITIEGGSLLVESESDTPPLSQCRVLTMLYRRFPPTPGYQSEGEMRSRSNTMPSRPRGRGQVIDEGILHSVQLMPTLITDSTGTQHLAGICCFLANKHHGYLYDVHSKTRLVSSFSFMSKTHMVTMDTNFIHALSTDSVETYTNRVFQATLQCPAVPASKSVEGRTGTPVCHSRWLKPPCPSPSMDLTLVSANKFIGSCCLATSPNHMIVLTKSGDAVSSGAGWLLQSLSLRKPQIEPTWNVYVLKKKDTISLYQQFLEYASSLKGSSPPMYQHVISEGHVLLRSQLLQESCLSHGEVSEMTKMLCENTHSLADSICTYAPNKAAILNAARYFALSGTQLPSVVQHITTTYPKGSSTPNSVLMSYLNLVLFAKEKVAISQALADDILQLYMESEPQQLIHVLLHSWLNNYSPDKALHLLNGTSQSLDAINEILLCQTLLLLRMNKLDSAQDKLSRIPDEFLSDWLKQNLHFVMNSKLTEFGKLLQLHKEACFIQLLTHCLSSKRLSFQNICSLLQGEGSCHGDNLADNVVLKQFLEKIILGKMEGVGSEVMEGAMFLLVDVLMSRLSCDHNPQQSTSAPFGLYGSRHKWLDSLPPFDGSASSDVSISGTMLQDLMQLQALLCGSYGARVAEHVEIVMEKSGRKVAVGSLSLQLLMWPHTGKMKQATELLLSKVPAVTVEYCLSYLSRHLDNWKAVLSLLLEKCTSENEEEVYYSLYKDALNHVVTLTTPEEFLSLLPSSGSVDFFLPYIECSCKLFLSKQLSEQLCTT